MQRMVGNWVNPLVGGMRASELSYDDLTKMAAAMDKAGLKPRSVAVRLNCLSMGLDYGVRRGYLGKNIISNVIKERGAGEDARIRTFSQEQVVQLLRTLEGPRPRIIHLWTWERLRLFVHIATFCGLRLGEIGALKAENIDVSGLTIRVRQSLTDYGTGLKPPKTKAGVPDVPMPPHVGAMLTHWSEHFTKPNSHGLLFQSYQQANKRFDSPTLQVSNFRRLWKQVLDLADLAADPVEGDFHFHALRHFAASYMIEHGLPIIETAAVLGHAKFDRTLQV